MSLSYKFDSVLSELEQVIATAPRFKASAWFNSDMDQLVFMFSDEESVADRVDEYLTVYENGAGQTVGYKIKGFRWVYELMTRQGRVEEGGFFNLIDAIITAWTAAAATANTDNVLDELRERHYHHVKDLSEGVKLPSLDELQAAPQ